MNIIVQYAKLNKGDNMTRQYTNKILELLEDGILDKDYVILTCLKYMSEDEVKDMAICNELLEDEE